MRDSLEDLAAQQSGNAPSDATTIPCRHLAGSSTFKHLSAEVLLHENSVPYYHLGCDELVVSRAADCLGLRKPWSRK